MTDRARGTPPETEGLRERKQRETRARIAAKGFALFLERGYDQTTLDDIADAAGISRRTFFSYYKSKDDIIIAWQLDGWQAMLAQLRTVSPDLTPLDAVRDMLVQNTAGFESEQMKTIDAMMRSSDTLMARKPAVYLLQEASLYEALCDVWRQPERRTALRMVAMVAIGTMRIAIETWRAEQGTRSAADVLQDAFSNLRTELRAESV